MENSLSPAAGRARAGATRVSGYAGRSRPIAGIATLLLLALSAAPLAAQHRPAEVHARVGTATFFEAARHVAAGASYRHYFGASGWALEPEYSFMTEGSHQDHMVILNVVKDFRPPSQTLVPYMVMGAGLNFHRNLGPCPPSPGGLGWGVGLKRRIGRRLFIAPEFRIGMEPNVRFSIRLGFAPRG